MATNYLTRSGTTPTSEQKGTFSAWVRVSDTEGSIGLVAQQADGNNQFMIFINATSEFEFYTTTSGSQFSRLVTNAKLRDPSAWYLLQAHWDNAQSTSSDRAKLYINGVEQSLSVASYPGQSNYNGLDGTGNQIVGSLSNLSYDCKADIADLYYIDGATIAVTEFYETDATTGEIKPDTNPTISSFGNAGYHLKFENANQGLDSKPSGATNFTTNGTIRKQEDNPSNVFATLNPLAGSISNNTLSNGNTSFQASSGWRWRPSTICPSKGKFYYEVKMTGSTPLYEVVGVVPQVSWKDMDGETIGAGANSEAESVGYNMNGTVLKANSTVYSGTSYTVGDVVCVAVDLDNRAIYFRKNGGSWENSGDPTSGASKTGAASLSTTLDDWSLSTSASGTDAGSSINYGNGYFGTTAVSSAGTNASGIGIFEFDCPNGYTALSTKGLNE